MARPSTTALRREQIADAFIEELAASGYDGATIARVAARAGLAPGLAHYHFASKEEILLLSVERLEQRLVARLPGDGGEPRARLLGAIQALLAASPPDTVAVRAWVVVGAEALRKPEVAPIYDAAVGRVRGRIARFVTDVLTAEGRELCRAEALITVVLCAAHGAWELGTATSQIPRGSAAAALSGVVVAGLDATPLVTPKASKR